MKKGIKLVHIYTGNSQVNIQFKTPKYPELLFHLEIVGGKDKRAGWELEKESSMTERKKKYASKWLEKNIQELITYFTEECPETKLLLLF